MIENIFYDFLPGVALIDSFAQCWKLVKGNIGPGVMLGVIRHVPSQTRIQPVRAEIRTEKLNSYCCKLSICSENGEFCVEKFNLLNRLTLTKF